MDKYFVQLRQALLSLHKTLLDYQQQIYERRHGRITSKGKLFSLVTGDAAFSWLRQLSELIVGLDEMFDEKKSSDQTKKDFIKYTAKLLHPSATGTAFAKQYYQAMQKDPGVALAHARVMQMLKHGY